VENLGNSFAGPSSIGGRPVAVRSHWAANR
jgi:hypothetical protein